MSTEEHTTDLKIMLFEDKIQELKKIPYEIEKMFQIQYPYRIVDKFVSAVQEYVISSILSLLKIDTIDESDEETIQLIQNLICDILTKNIAKFICNEIRKRVVQYHAMGCTTTEIVNILIEDHPAMRRLAKEDALGIQKLRRLLVQRLAYLKPGHPRWPEEKFGELWRRIRDEKNKDSKDIPLSTTGEQVNILVENVRKMQTALEKEDITPREIYLISNSITKTIQTLNKIKLSEKT
ncbi:hypothetical protein JT359_03335 [Candidatus Poribacteria bacterium]|nr:hypothetical protein [Candidatus Poribacteria bacterium]